MTITVGKDSYVDISGADQYFNTRYGYDKWTALPDPDKEKLLISSAQLLDQLCIWDGEKCDPQQKLEFPRTDTCPNIPYDIVMAQLELAYVIMDQGGVSAGSGGDAPITELKAGSVQLKFDTSKQGTTSKRFPVPGLAQMYLARHGRCAFGATRVIPICRN